MGYSWAAYAPPKNFKPTRASLVPSPVSVTISRCCDRKHGGYSQAAKAQVPAGGSVGWESPRAPHHLAGCWVLAPGHSICFFLFTCVFPPGIASHDSAFPNIKVFGSLPRDCSGGVHASPFIIILLQRASCSWGTSTMQPKSHQDSHHRGLEAHDVQYH